MKRDQKGQAIIEFAIMMPLLLILVIGIIQFGIVFNNYITLTNAVAIGARTLAINRGLYAGPPTACTAAQTAITNAAVTLSPSQIVYPSPWPTFPSPDTSTCTNLVSGETVTVTIQYPCNLMIFGVNYAPGCTLTAATTVRIE
jgi:Flp pilus assembly protein TadG